MLSGLFCLLGTLPVHADGKEIKNEIKNASVEFRVSSPNLKSINGARIIVIGDNGDIMANGTTNTSGIWSTTLRVKQDPRFSNVRQMGTVTAIVVADGYNEEAVFEVPVFPGSIQPVTMAPIQPNHRNEPIKDLGNLHRHDLTRMIDQYAKELGLSKQTAIQGEQGYSSWSPHWAQRR